MSNAARIIINIISNIPINVSTISTLNRKRSLLYQFDSAKHKRSAAMTHKFRNKIKFVYSAAAAAAKRAAKPWQKASSL